MWYCDDHYPILSLPTGMYIENEDGKLVPLKADHDVLNLKEKQVVVVEIKD